MPVPVPESMATATAPTAMPEKTHAIKELAEQYLEDPEAEDGDGREGGEGEEWDYEYNDGGNLVEVTPPPGPRYQSSHNRGPRLSQDYCTQPAVTFSLRLASESGHVRHAF